MKKVLMNFSENVLSRSQMKIVKGGVLDVSGCTRDCPGKIPDVKCSGDGCYTFEEDGGGCFSQLEGKKYCITT